MAASQIEVTQLLCDWSSGDKAALDKLVPVVYQELRRLASYYMRRERPGHTALTSLEAIDPRKSRIVDLRYIGGLNIEETAEVLGISPATVQRERRSAKAWLYREIKKEDTRDEA